MKSDDNELKPCPFCGSEVVKVKDMHLVRPSLIETHINVWVDCPECPCNFHMEFTNKDKNWRETFIAKWNDRPASKTTSATKPVRTAAAHTQHQEKLF